jgi:hypothetical protein
VDYLDAMKAMVPVEVVHCTSDRSPLPAYFAQSPIAMQVEPSAVFTRLQRGDEQTQSPQMEMGIVFSYEPPAGLEADFAPAGPILEPLGPPVWGTLIAT